MSLFLSGLRVSILDLLFFIEFRIKTGRHSSDYGGFFSPFSVDHLLMKFSFFFACLFNCILHETITASI